MVPDENKLNAIADALVGPGYTVLDNLLPVDLLNALHTHCDSLHSNTFKSAGVGRQADFQLQENVRSDKIHWLESDTPPTAGFLRYMDSLRSGLNQRLFLGLNDYESHFAHYSVGAFYKKHLDAFNEKSSYRVQSAFPEQKSNRVISTILYLNENWQADEGGELVIYNEGGEQAVEKILPQLGRVVIFLSEKFPHEVLPAKRERNSIAGWFRASH